MRSRRPQQDGLPAQVADVAVVDRHAVAIDDTPLIEVGSAKRGVRGAACGMNRHARENEEEEPSDTVSHERPDGHALRDPSPIERRAAIVARWTGVRIP